MIPENEPLRVGLIGAGRWGLNILRTALTLPDLQIRRVARAQSQPLAELPDGAELVTDWQRVADAPDLDAVIIATPPHTHRTMMTLALRRRLAIFIEKPLSLNLADAQALAEQAQEVRAIVFVDHIHLFNPAFRSLVAARARVGGIQRVESIAGSRGPIRTDCPVLWDWGPHDVAMMLELFGCAPHGVRACRETAGPEAGAETIRLDLTFPTDVPAVIRVSNMLPAKHRSFRVIGARGELGLVDGAPPHVTFRDSASGTTENIAFSPDTSLTVALREFAAAARTGSCNLASLDRALDVTRVLADAEQHLAAN